MLQSVTWSPARSQEVRLALRAAMAAPDVRTDKVVAARQRIAQGTFTVRADVVAWGILNARV
ncbi:MAG: flagellar biosynthesis anti-sigma factor FlgM [Candidatus Limnocylindrales bacterium]